MEISNSYITLKGLRFYAFHGVEPQERIVGAWYRIDLVMTADISRSVETDAVADTLNYAEAAAIIKEEMAIPSDLLEHVAGRIGSHLFQAFPTLEGLTVTVAKEHPPVCCECSSAEVTLTLRRK